MAQPVLVVAVKTAFVPIGISETILPETMPEVLVTGELLVKLIE